MSVIHVPTSRDTVIEEAFGAPVGRLYEMACGPTASAALTRALELRSFLAVAEEQVARVRNRVHDATSTDLDFDDLSANDLRWDAEWLEAALTARTGYTTALSELLRTMPPTAQKPGLPVRFAQPKITTTLTPAAPAPAGAVAVRERQP
ncbi:hypothetical protein [Streptomyces sp. SID1121]|uniref:hypothetical protein n=1 Tax=Streptomyces sp. SID1121 TaxID=3425888 RepID=UPI004056793B